MLLLHQAITVFITVELILGVSFTSTIDANSHKISEQEATLESNNQLHQRTLDISEESLKESVLLNNPKEVPINQAPRDIGEKKVEPKPNLHDLDPLRIVVHHKEWITDEPSEGLIENCDIPCIHSTDKSEASLNSQSTAAIVFIDPNFWRNPRPRLDGRGSQALTVALSMESSVYYPIQKNLSDYDLSITSSFDSDLPLPYFEWHYDLLKDVSEWPWEKREPAIAFVARNCNSRSNREALVKMLGKYVRVDSVSSCLNNHPWPSDIHRSDKDGLLKRYMMYLAAENSIEKDYVTEKVYNGLVNGAVTLYLGAPNVEEFVPSHSIIPIPENFTEADVVQIAELADNIFTNKTAYEEWTEFKKHPYEESFKRKFNMQHTRIWCRLCRKIYALKNGYRWDKELQEVMFN